MRCAHWEPIHSGTSAKVLAAEGVMPGVTLWRSLGEGRCFLEGGYASVTYLSASGSMGTGYSPVKQAVQ